MSPPGTSEGASVEPGSASDLSTLTGFVDQRLANEALRRAAVSLTQLQAQDDA